MNLPVSHGLQSRLAGFSIRLQHLAQAGSESTQYVDQKITVESLQYGVSFTLAQLIRVLTFIDRSKKVFEDLLQDFNLRRNTTLTYEELENLGWVRYINNEVLLPSSVNYLVWQIGTYKQSGKHVDIPEDKTEHIAFLREFYEQYYDDPKLTISATDLATLLAQSAHAAVSIPFLLERKIIAESNGGYTWEGGNYVRQLQNEIAASL